MSVSNGPPKRGLRLSCPAKKIRPFETNPTRNIQQNKSPHLTTSTPEEPQSGFAEVSIFIQFHGNWYFLSPMGSMEI